MGKNLVMDETEEFHRVWNLIVPLHKLGNNGHIQSIPPLTKNPFRKNERRKTKKRAC
jgi:hypothetical protein